MSNTELIAKALREEADDILVLGGDIIDHRIANALERIADRIDVRK